MNRRQIKEAIDKADNVFHNCFDWLKHPNNSNKEDSSSLLQFQSGLAQGLFDLMKFYQNICQYEKQLIINKADYKYSWFSNRMSCLKGYKGSVSDAIQIGKSIGDAFAWMFFQTNMDILRQHLLHNDNGLFVSGIGGLGEMEFIKNNPVFDGSFVVYHGITSILRIGDFSLYHPKVGVYATGELKTKDMGNGLIEVNAIITSRIPFSDGLDSIDFKWDNDPDRFRRQQQVIDECLKKIIPDRKNELYDVYMYYLFDEVEPNKETITVDKGKTLVLYTYPLHHRKLSNILLSKYTNLHKREKDVIQNVISILEKPSKNNRMIMGDIDNCIRRGKAPVFWWPINLEIIEKIMFKQLFAITIFNPAIIYDHFSEKGYDIIELNDGHGTVKLEKMIGAQKIVIDNLGMFIDLVTTNLYSPQGIIDIIESAIESVDLGKIDRGLNLQINVIPKI